MFKQSVIAVMIVSFLTAGCVGQGEMIRKKVIMPGGETVTYVSYNNNIPNFLRGRDSFTYSYIIKEDTPSGLQMKAVQTVWRHCRDNVDIVHPNRFVSVATYGILFGAAGAVGGALGAQFFSYAITGEYAGYAGVAGATFGAAYGLTVLTGELYTFQSCARELMHQFPRYGIRVVMDSPTP